MGFDAKITIGEVKGKRRKVKGAIILGNEFRMWKAEVCRRLNTSIFIIQNSVFNIFVF